jgi:hypothetical protein
MIGYLPMSVFSITSSSGLRLYSTSSDIVGEHTCFNLIISQLCAETKKFSTECPFWSVSSFHPSNHCACPILAFFANWNTVDHEHGRLCTRELEK